MAVKELKKLYRFFQQAVKGSFYDLGITEPEITCYVAEVLTEFAKTDSLYKIRNAQGEKLTTIVDMLIEAFTFYREREIKKHIGDYTLFMTGIFREYVEKRGFLGFYLEEGKKAYFSVFDLNKSVLFWELAKDFELYSGALDYMRKTFFKGLKGKDPFSDFAYQISKYVH
ncbi:MAG: hypothetical protein J7J46_03390 [Candidatus Desulfofervidus sp.]|nr:hypothetical protein [Candidatus Desulfofervidus sp.]